MATSMPLLLLKWLERAMALPECWAGNYASCGAEGSEWAMIHHGRSTSLIDWRRLEDDLEAIVSQSGVVFDPATIANVRELLAQMRDRSPVPEIAKGYWSTIRFLWGETLEFEVFASSIEIYRFPGGRFDIEYHDHKPGEPFSPEVIGALPERHD